MRNLVTFAGRARYGSEPGQKSMTGIRVRTGETAHVGDRARNVETACDRGMDPGLEMVRRTEPLSWWRLYNLTMSQPVQQRGANPGNTPSDTACWPSRQADLRPAPRTDHAKDGEYLLALVQEAGGQGIFESNVPDGRFPSMRLPADYEAFWMEPAMADDRYGQMQRSDCQSNDGHRAGRGDGIRLQRSQRAR